MLNYLGVLGEVLRHCVGGGGRFLWVSEFSLQCVGSIIAFLFGKNQKTKTFIEWSHRLTGLS